MRNESLAQKVGGRDAAESTRKGSRSTRRVRVARSPQAAAKSSRPCGQEHPLAGRPIADHPLAAAAGTFADDPFWDRVQKAIHDHRGELDREFE